MHFDVWYERPAATEECHGGMCVDVDRILGKSWWPDVCHLAQGAHTLHTWNPVGQKSGARAFDWRTRMLENIGQFLLIGNFRRRLARELLVVSCYY